MEGVQMSEQPINDGGPAFPRSATDHCHSQEGMTLRDYFAGKAIEALIVRGWGLEAASGKAYEIADEMIKAKNKK
jgi:hypothetical protein